MKLFVGLTAVWLCLGSLELECAAKPADKKITTSVDESQYAESDSDMLTEPDEVSVTKSHSHQIYPHARHFQVQSLSGAGVNLHQAQNLYSSFFRDAQPLGHSRPFAPDVPVPSKSSGQHPRSFDHSSLLGSGDFGVIRGGTFYPEDENPFASDETGEFSQIYGDKAKVEEYVQKYTYPEEQFAKFRDFADMNTQADAAFSQFDVVYAAKNSTTANHSNPKNIFEQLQLLDKEKAMEEKKKKKSRISKSKSKLESTKRERKYMKKMGPKDLDDEPLLALS